MQLQDQASFTSGGYKYAAHNAYVDIDSVSYPPGEHYSNWITITKNKLKERETELLPIKCKKIESVVNSVLNHYQSTFLIPDQIQMYSFLRLCQKIDEWKGVNLGRRKKAFTRYRDYFTVSRNWWLQCKQGVFGSIFWVYIFEIIQKFARDALDTLQTMDALFNATIKYCNSGPKPLINGGTALRSIQMQQYLSSLHPTLNIENIKHQQSGKILICEIRRLLNVAVAAEIVAWNNTINHMNHHQVQTFVVDRNPPQSAAGNNNMYCFNQVQNENSPYSGSLQLFVVPLNSNANQTVIDGNIAPIGNYHNIQINQTSVSGIRY